ncbi:TPA: hypothetical protein ACH3X2_004751 [Trebouxia sp. C0005]
MISPPWNLMTMALALTPSSQPPKITYNIEITPNPGLSVAFATDKTGQKVADFPKPICKLPPAVDQLEDFIFHPLAAKLPVVDSIYNALVARNDSLKASIEPASLSGADTLAALILVALETDFDGGDEIAIAGQVDNLLYKVWHCMSKHDNDDKFSN